ncbi:MAG: cytidylate kinase family protein [Oscillospiraceae bacterium]|nr:cytidylate kinase family protein [Oscillospiraceae bacterium]
MSKTETIKRYVLFVIGVFLMSMGTAIVTRTGLGTSPVSSIPYTLSLKFGLSLGAFTMAFNVLLIVLQIVILRKNFKPIQFLQVPVVLAFSVFMDVSMSLMSFINISFYPLRIVVLLLGCAVLALGVTLEVTANVVMLTGEAFVKAVSTVLKKDFGTMKIAIDATFTVLACILSLVLMGGVYGVREGTVVSALTVGMFAKFFTKRLAFLDAILSDRTGETAEEAPILRKAGANHIVITIGREFGSGGHLIGEMIAQRLGITFYDKEIIDMAAQESGLAPEYVAKNEQKMTNSLLYDLVMQNYAYSKEDMAPADALFQAQSKVIRTLAATEACVIVGRCAGQVLKDDPACFRIFVHANKEDRLQRIVNEYGISPVEAPEQLQKTDSRRATHYKRYTGMTWGLAENYHISIDSSVLGVDATVDQILDILGKWQPAAASNEAA